MIAAALLGCAPNVAPVTLEAVIQVESGGNPLALNVNGLRVQPAPARDAHEAAEIASRYIAWGYSVDLGLMQVNSRNLPALGYSIEQVLEPCTNIRGGAVVLTADYAEAVRTQGEGQPALQAALSAYNTGSFYRGLANGYVARYYGPRGVPALAGAVRQAAATQVASVPRQPPPAPQNPYTAETTVYAREAISVPIE
jgi:type IV secretion system protein VirB1